jgi:hypothetical protein
MAEELTLQKLRSLGGFARAQKMTAEERRESARRAARARWAKKNNGGGNDNGGGPGPGSWDGNSPASDKGGATGIM